MVTQKVLKSFVLLSILVTFTLLSTAVKAQAKTILDYYEANQNQNSILLKWAISKGSTCNGINITRSSDSLYFETIGRIEGVCGSPDFQQPYSFVDESPLKNQMNYYKLELGINEFSEIISLYYLEKNEVGYQIIPQPMHNQGRIYFDNSDRQRWDLSVFNMNGQLIYQSSTKENYFDIETSRFSSGMLFFQLSSNDEQIKGKLLISK